MPEAETNFDEPGLWIDDFVAIAGGCDCIGNRGKVEIINVAPVDGSEVFNTAKVVVFVEPIGVLDDDGTKLVVLDEPETVDTVVEHDASVEDDDNDSEALNSFTSHIMQCVAVMLFGCDLNSFDFVCTSMYLSKPIC